MKPSKEELEELYINNNLSRKEIALRYNKSEALIKLWLKEYNIKKDRQLITECQLREKEKIYGKGNYFNRKKSKQTKLEKYGDENYTNREKAKQTCLEKYGVEIPSKIFYEKIKETKLEKYGDENYNNRNKAKETCLEKYGLEYYTNREKCCQTKLGKYGNAYYNNIEQIKETKLEKYNNPYYFDKDKMIQTNNERYGIDYILQNNQIRERSKITKLEKYGDENYNNRNKAKETCLEKYGSDSYLQSEQFKSDMLERYGTSDIVNEKWFKDKCYKTKLEKGTINSSNEEDEVFNLLNQKFSNVKRNYKTDEYPYACDFYIPEFGLYIELNYHWTHGYDIFNPLNEKHMEQLNKWKNKNSKYYNQAIYVWTDLDIRKRNIAEANKLNWLCFYNTKDFMEWYNNV